MSLRFGSMRSRPVGMCHPSTGAIFRRWAQLMHGRSDDLIEDAMIAATAAVHGLTVVTRHVQDIRHFGVKTLDPFKAG